MEGVAFGRYRLDELIARGGMGEVWRAHDTATNRIVAIKLLPPHLAADDTFVQRFRREAEAAARLNNPHIIPIHDYGEIDGRLYVNMRLVEGRDLQEVLADGPLEPGRAVRIIEQVAKALHAAHKIGLVHRDVKPSNILIDEDDFAYLIDFGIARGVDQTGLTGTGGVIGTWHYMAPERLSAREADARSDIYALACVLHECLTGSRPFPGESLESQVAAHLTAPPPRPSITRPEVPQRFDAVIKKGMAKDPGDRYPTTVELARDARDAVTAPTERPEPTPAPSRDRLGRPDQHQRPPPSPHQLRSPPAPPARADFAPAPQRPPAEGFWPAGPPISPGVGLPPEHRPPRAPWWRRKAVVVPSAVLLTVIAVAVAVTVAVSGDESGPSTSRSEPTRTTNPARTPTLTIPTGMPTTFGTQFETGDTISYWSMGTAEQLDCGTGKSLTVLGSTNTLTVTGVCTDVTVLGSGNTITLNQVDKLINVLGSDNKITYKTGEPQIDDLGQTNQVTKG